MYPKKDKLKPGKPAIHGTSGKPSIPGNHIYRKAAFLLAKTAVSLSIIVFLLSKVNTANVIVFFKNINLVEFSAAISINILVIYMASFRLGLFIPRYMPVNKIFSINLIGQFFNNLLPGSTG
ncbi:MAG: flippase-like domain-containing protein, partial [Nitrospirae bacterium]|nr:flippase-like domain-containing protein [Nitrospirota bacterium]